MSGCELSSEPVHGFFPAVADIACTEAYVDCDFLYRVASEILKFDDAGTNGVTLFQCFQ